MSGIRSRRDRGKEQGQEGQGRFRGRGGSGAEGRAIEGTGAAEGK